MERNGRIELSVVVLKSGEGRQRCGGQIRSHTPMFITNTRPEIVQRWWTVEETEESKEVAWIVKKRIEILRFLADNRSEPQGPVLDTEILFLERTKQIQI
ncbi:unnamed protein product [Arabis nemorensis]|uniref:Uncharacterized protein n=1 Tax=Arabis nemorensis TaxID=586526 RepID=A0A565CD67_9BRAS|nr:unnamed protein product [Arabis nemorensis]